MGEEAGSSDPVRHGPGPGGSRRGSHRHRSARALAPCLQEPAPPFGLPPARRPGWSPHGPRPPLCVIGRGARLGGGGVPPPRGVPSALRRQSSCPRLHASPRQGVRSRLRPPRAASVVVHARARPGVHVGVRAVEAVQRCEVSGRARPGSGLPQRVDDRGTGERNVEEGGWQVPVRVRVGGGGAGRVVRSLCGLGAPMEPPNGSRRDGV